ncbi:hypothetical protein OSB04_013715 [Centaurea solstitialis]|uniref:Uncharacterized protein n=1 Tax=Centaurea solstitialis TaxID=347529 RepID=A0AA38WRF3_9ASTR|nr:hypothetical protein OSB04_013715 [Centaurea solstitialis]
MRRSLGKLSHQAIIGQTTAKSILLSSSSSFDFSTTAGNNGGGGGGGGGGRGRGRGSDFPKFSFVDSSSAPGKKIEPTNHEDETSSPSPLGHGRGKPLSSSVSTPPFGASSGGGANRGATVTAGRGRGTVQSSQFGENPRRTAPPPPRTSQSDERSSPRTPVFFRKDGEVNLPKKGSVVGDESENIEKDHLPKTILSFLSGAGRGKPTQSATFVDGEKVEEVNRHVKPRPPVQGRPPMQGRPPVQPPRPASPKMSQEEAINKARGILFKEGDGGGVESGGGEPQGGFRGMGGRDGGGGGRGQRGGFVGRGRGRGMGGGRGRGRGRGRGMSYRDDDDGEEEEEETAEDKANAEKLARFLGPEKMDLLVQAFEEASGTVLPSPEEDAHVDAMHTNLLLECEPEYLMAEFDSNPDIDEKPPISLEDALQKMKPFLMAYEDIKTDKEWREVVEETMKNLPLMKELVDYYGGPKRATAKNKGRSWKELQKLCLQAHLRQLGVEGRHFEDGDMLFGLTYSVCVFASYLFVCFNAPTRYLFLIFFVVLPPYGYGGLYTFHLLVFAHIIAQARGSSLKHSTLLRSRLLTSHPPHLLLSGIHWFSLVWFSRVSPIDSLNRENGGFFPLHIAPPDSRYGYRESVGDALTSIYKIKQNNIFKVELQNYGSIAAYTLTSQPDKRLLGKSHFHHLPDKTLGPCCGSYQSNPGWGFDRKCQFMDKLAWEVSQSYKQYLFFFSTNVESYSSSFGNPTSSLGTLVNLVPASNM